jgi:hypothetical protein
MLGKQSSARSRLEEHYLEKDSERGGLAMKRMCIMLCQAMVITLVGCGSSSEKAANAQKNEGKDVASQAEAVLNDQRVLREANAAVNEVVRLTGDCEALAAVLPEAHRKLDEAESRVQTATGRQTIVALRTRIRGSAELCP